MKKLTFLLLIVATMGITFSCSKTEDNDPDPGGSTPGPKFLAVKSIVTSSCAMSGCHIAPANAGGLNLETNASIVSNASRIKSMAVDQGSMPPTGQLSAAAKASISDWISAGGRLAD